jgi:hypothetical protein
LPSAKGLPSASFQAIAGSIAPNSTDGSFRPNAAYAALIVSTADIR